MGEGEPGSYTLIADAIRRWGADTKSDLHELWRRMVFSLLASNSDDHLRNHGFLMRQPGRWSLAPACDLNPVPALERAREPQTPIDEDQPSPSIAAALAVSRRFLLDETEARAILGELVAAIDRWRTIGRKLRIRAAVLDEYASAFSNPLLEEAAKLQ
jgi:serine/threonine-protein kinase HipA